MNTFQEIPASKQSYANRKTVLNVGINDASYKTTQTINGKSVNCPYYRVWLTMLSRCYSKKFLTKRSTYLGCTVCKEWLLFSNFKLWMQTQDWQNKQLDKDLRIPGNKVYSKDTCMFVTPEVNNLFNSCTSKRGKYLIGVCWDSKVKKYRSQCRVDGKEVYLGIFNTEQEAHNIYYEYKRKMLLNKINKQSGELVNILIQYLNFMYPVKELLNVHSN